MGSPLTLLPGAYNALGYHAADVERKSGRALPRSGSPDTHTRPDRELLGRMARRFHRDNGIYQSIINRSMEAIFGEGWGLQVNTGVDDLDSEIERDFAKWAKKPEVRGLFDFDDCQKMAATAVFNDGDLGCVLTNRNKLQYVVSERITGGRRQSAASRKGGRVEQGVEMDRLGAPIAYWVAPYDQFGYLSKAKAKRIKERDFLFLPALNEFDQTRGVPVLTSSFPMIHRIKDVCDSEAIAWQLLSRFALTISRDNGAAQAHLESESDSGGKDSPPDAADRVMDFDEAIIFNANNGESLRGIDRNLPGANFSESVRMYLRLIGLPLGLPLEIMLLDYSKMNYSSSRAALEQAYRMFRAWQRFFDKKHSTPIFEWWLLKRIEKGFYPSLLENLTVLEEGADLTILDFGVSHEFIKPEFPWIDQLKEAQAWGARIDRGLATQSQALKSVGMDRDNWIIQREKEIESAIEAADRINKRHKDANVDWRAFAGVPVSKMQGNFAAVEPGGDPENEPLDPKGPEDED